MRTRFALAAAALLVAATPAFAQDVAALKAQGLVGEQADGLLGFVKPEVPADVRQAVDTVNAQRKRQYEEVAKGAGTPVADVQKVAGERLIGATPPGQYVRGAGGWTKK
jgi:uncharacterized protein YdbL (DUF1318 family)